jgi:hypothetical protein
MIATHQPGLREQEADGPRRLPGTAARRVARRGERLQRRLAPAGRRRWDYDATMKAWPSVESRLRRDGAKADLTDLMMDVRGASIH